MGQHWVLLGLVRLCLFGPPGQVRDLSPAETAMVGVPRRRAVQEATEGLGSHREERQVQPKKQRPR